MVTPRRPCTSVSVLKRSIDSRGARLGGHTVELMTLLNVAFVSLLAVAAPAVARGFPRAMVPGIVVEILAGLAVGPHGLGWLRVDGALSTLALLGVTFLFFLAGLEVDFHQIGGPLLARSAAAYGLGFALALLATVLLRAAGLVQAPVLVAIALSATGLGLVIPILRNAGLLHTGTGTTVVGAASVAEFSAVVLLALLFSTGGSPLGSAVLLVALAALSVGVALIGRRVAGIRRVTTVLDSLSGGTVQLRVRLSVTLVVCFAALAQWGGLEVVLGAFFAGGILHVLDDSMRDPNLRGRLDGLGYGFFIPVFFITSGATLDLSALDLWPDVVVLVPLLVLVLLFVRATPEVVLRLGVDHRHRVGAGLMCATSLPFIVTATQVGVATGRLDTSTAAAVTTAGLIGVCVFPAIGVSLLSGRTTVK